MHMAWWKTVAAAQPEQYSALSMYKISFYVPMEAAEAVKSALFAAGAGRMGNYDCCSWQCLGAGQFRPLAGSAPAIGQQDELARLPELQVEMVCDDACLPATLAALFSAHPYETPAFAYWRINEPLPAAGLNQPVGTHA